MGWKGLESNKTIFLLPESGPLTTESFNESLKDLDNPVFGARSSQGNWHCLFLSSTQPDCILCNIL